MYNSIAVMNTKGGVGKSTLVLALAETISAYHGKNVLVIDSDAQASVSSMLMSVPDLYKLQNEGRTIVDFLVATVLNGTPTDWTQFVVPKVSDVDDARGVYLLPSDMQLTLLEREVSKESQHTRLRSSIGRLLADAGNVFDVVLIDCPPGLSVLTECWLREADFHISPTKPDYVSVCGLEVFRRFKALNPEMGFARNLGVIVNLEDNTSPSDAEYTAWLGANTENRCFSQSVPRVKSLQDAARHQSLDRSYAAKYPGTVGVAIRNLTSEVMERLQVDQTAAALAAAAEDARRALEARSAPAPAQPSPPAAHAAPAGQPAAAAAPAAPAATPVSMPAQPTLPARPAAPSYEAALASPPAVARSTPAAVAPTPVSAPQPTPMPQTVVTPTFAPAAPAPVVAPVMPAAPVPTLEVPARPTVAQEFSASLAAAALAPVTAAMSIATAAMAPMSPQRFDAPRTAEPTSAAAAPPPLPTASAPRPATNLPGSPSGPFERN